MLQQLAGEFVRGLSAECLAALESRVRDEQFPPGTRLFAEGSRHESFHVVLQGHVRLEMSVPGRCSIPLLTVGPGDVLAWSALLGNGTMTTSAVALDSVRLATWSGSELRKLCEDQPQLGFSVMAQMATALSQRLLATRLQLLDVFAEHEPKMTPYLSIGRPVGPKTE